MALIQCTECGRMISDKAACCPNCGAPVEKQVICEDCGFAMSPSMVSCPECGCPNPFCQQGNAAPHQPVFQQQQYVQQSQQPFSQQPQQQAFAQQPQQQTFAQQSQQQAFAQQPQQNFGNQPTAAEMESRVNRFLIRNKDFLPEREIGKIREYLMSLDKNQMNVIEGLSFQTPMTVWIVSFFLGYLGIDRFIIGDTMMGILKLLTGGLCGIMWLVDLFLITGKTREANFKKLQDAQHFV